MAGFRGLQTIWAAAVTGAGGASTSAVIGSDSNVCIFVTVSGATTINIQVAPGNGSAGMNAQPATSDYMNLFKRDGSGALTIVFAGSGSAAIDVSPMAAQFVRLTSTNSVTATAYVDVATMA